MEDAIGLAVVDVAEAGFAYASVRSRRAPASIINDAGKSAGVVGEVPANGSSTWVIRFAPRFSNGVWLAPDAACRVVTAVAGADDAFATDDVDTGLGVFDCEMSGVGVALGVIIELSTVTRLVATVPLVAILSGPTVADTGVEPVTALEDVDDDDPLGLGPGFRDLPPPAVAKVSRGAPGGRWDGVSSEGSLEVELSSLLADEDRVGACEEDDWLVVTPVVPGSPALCALPVLAVLPSLVGEFGWLSVESASDVGFEELGAPDEPAEVCGDAEVAGAVPAEMALPDLGDAPVPVDEEPSEPCSADATPHPVKNAVPTPSATASPPTRPIYLEAFISPPAVRKLSITDGVSDRDHMRLG